MSAAPDIETAVSACPACIAAPAAQDLARRAIAAPSLSLSLPSIHCAACITDVEACLGAIDGVRDARVNLTLKRVAVQAGPEITAAQLIGALEGIGYEAHELDPDVLRATETDRQGRDYLMRIGVAGFAMMNIMLLSVAVWSGAGDATRDMFHWISAAIAFPTVIFAGQPFFASAYRALRARRLGMDVPISLAILLSTGMSLFETIHSGRHAYYDAAVMLIFFLLVGRYLDYRSRSAARSAAEELAALEVPRAWRVTDAGETEVPVADLRVGDHLRLRPGGRLAADGVVLEGRSETDRSLLTGESLPVSVGPGAVLSAGEVNLTGPLLVRLTAVGRDSSLHRMAQLVAAAETARTRYTTLAERATRAYTPLVHLMAFSAFAVWMWLSGDLRLALNIAAAVLIITCPCALGLAVPAVVTAASGRLFRQGLLVKDGSALERLAEVDCVVFDKTGTLTMGLPEPADLAGMEAQARRIALALAAASSHPLSVSLAEMLRAEGVEPQVVEGLCEVPGCGIEARDQGRRIRLGRADWVGAQGEGTWLDVGQGNLTRLRFQDRLRPGAAEAVRACVARGLSVRLVSGDTTAAVSALAARLGIADWQAEARPEDKAATLATLSGAGHHVLMVGDGLNDTIALAQAHVSISPASALDAARTASDIVLLGQNLEPIAEALQIARKARARIKQNFAISIGYNMIAVPIALLGLATPLAAALAMSASSITVSLNSLRLK
ncbi:heavy metal translocating P-type ATPase [Thioclava litoralis]|uniref:Heavy metal translocating P-type ATPase n=1 Tax=Thioclava litoralis TaxID=3076557 RepID=A0ABZ1DV86_9RHOB|nr:heavy metal translocating P-type ATPase [Thioclava sp. FTW29]